MWLAQTETETVSASQLVPDRTALTWTKSRPCIPASTSLIRFTRWAIVALRSPSVECTQSSPVIGSPWARRSQSTSVRPSPTRSGRSRYCHSSRPTSTSRRSLFTPSRDHTRSWNIDWTSATDWDGHPWHRQTAARSTFQNGGTTPVSSCTYISVSYFSDVKRGQNLEAEANFLTSRPIRGQR